MMYELKFSDYLYEDVKSSVNYIKYVLQNPFIYPAVPVEYLALKGYRFVNIKNYMLFFKVKEKQINIERFLYGPRDWINLLKNMN